MKRFVTVLLALALCGLGWAAAEEVQLRVVNCKEWVSLRSAADTQSERLAQVPLGASVFGEYDPAAEFSHCRYGDRSGYILNTYLAPAEEAAGTADPAPEGEVILEYGAGDRQVRAIRSCASGSESLWIACTDDAGAVLWSYAVGPLEMTELTLTDAFVDDRAAEPFAVVYSAARGLEALDLDTGALLWALTPEQVSLGGSITWVVGEDGTMYIGGYYGPDPVAISPEGALLWQASSRYGDLDGYPLEFWWLYHLEIEDAGLVATYDSGSESAGRVLFGLDGRMLAYSFMDE